MLDFSSRRQHKLRDLHRQYAFLYQKIQRLKMDYIAENDTLTKFKLEHAIHEEEEYLEEIEQNIDKLERIDIAITLHKALLKLNYQSQVSLFLQMTEHSKAGAFLIHGEADYGQCWLLNRLVQRVIESVDDVVIPISFCPWQRWDLNTVLREVGKKLNVRNISSLYEVVERVYDCWQKKTVIFIFHRVGDVDPHVLQEIKEQFWDELVRRSRERPGQKEKSRLLMFFVDDAGSLDEWPFPCVEQVDASWTPEMPIKSPVLAPIGIEELTSWMKHECEELSSKIRNTPVHEIWHRTNKGTPQDVLEHLCMLGDCDWSELERLWIKY